MSFSTDRQTLEEMNILGKYRQGSVYHLFNQVRTRGGERLLDQMFRSPLQNPVLINDRATIFRFFQGLAHRFPFDPARLSLMQDYLDTGSRKHRFAILLDSSLKKILSDLTRDERFKKSIQGLHASIETIKCCHDFIALLGAATGPFAARVASIRDLLGTPQFRQLLEVDIYKPLPLGRAAYYHYLLKTKVGKDIRSILEFIYEVDVYTSVSKVASQRRLVYATALPASENIFDAENLFHPAVEHAVGNSLHMEAHDHVLFLTGANMAGKSTLMKSIGIAVYLAHMGFPVAASSMRFSIREGMYSSINVADNIALGYSHFYAEVMRVKKAAEAAASGKRLLLLFDELFKGTNVKDAFDGTLAVTDAFADYTECLFVVSTHIIEVGEALKIRNDIQFRFLPTIMEGSRPRYTYSLQQGITEDRQGMLIIRNEGILDMINTSLES